MKSWFHTFVKNLIMVFSFILGILTLVSILLTLFGLRPFILESSSMEPLYKRGSLIWCDTRVKPDNLSIGDAVIYRATKEMIVLHRVVGDNLLQGDANSKPQEVKLNDVNLIGREVFTIPGLGYVASVLLSFPVWILAVVFLVLACVPSRLSNKKNGTESEVPA